MIENEAIPTEDRPISGTLRRWGNSAFVKLAVLGFLVMLLLIPVSRVTSLVHERMVRQGAVEREIADTWGGEQTLLGPVLTVPYRLIREEVKVRSPAASGWVDGDARSTVERTRKVEKRRLHLLPQEIAWKGRIAPQIRNRGIFQVVVYEAQLQAEGFFELPESGAESFALELSEGREGETVAVDWQRAALALGVSDLRGLQARANLTWNGETLAFLPGSGETGFLGSGIHAPLEADDQGVADDAGVADAPGVADDPDTADAGGAPREKVRKVPFRFELDLRGSDRILFLPAGEETRLELASEWPSPGFTGAFLPNSRELSEDGFAASWNVPFFGRSFPQQWTGESLTAGELAAAAFGVRLELPADAYQQTERSVKYAVLFILLTFGTFFLLELASPVRLHAVQYLLVGFALCLFYVLLLAFAEHLGFGPAYALAAVATVGLIAAYGGAILASRARASVLLGCLGGLYGYLYVLLRLESFALLLGALGLFAALAAIMALTRRLDWHTLRFRSA